MLDSQAPVIQNAASKKSAQWGNTVINKTVIEGWHKQVLSLRKVPGFLGVPGRKQLQPVLSYEMGCMFLRGSSGWWLVFIGRQQHLHICGAGAK